MQETDSIDKSLVELAQITVYLARTHSQIYHTRNSARSQSFKVQLLSTKTNLLSLRGKLQNLPSRLSDPPTELIDNLVFEMDNLHRDVMKLPWNVLQEQTSLVQRIIATIKGLIPFSLLELQIDLPDILERVPSQVRKEVNADFQEVSKCYSAQAYRAGIIFCARIVETILQRKYYDKRRGQGLRPDQIESELAGLTLGRTIEKCRQQGLVGDIPGLKEYSAMVNALRIPSVHVTKPLFGPGPEAVKGIISLTLELIKTLY